MTSQPRILFMEDDPGVARLFERKLTKMGYQVEVVAAGPAGLARCQEEAFDLVAVDQSMPGMSGLEVIAALQALPKPPPTIMITGAGCEHTAVQALKLGAQDYIIKDVEGVFFELIPTVITQIFNKQQAQANQDRVQQALRESEERYRSLVESSPDGILVVVDGIIEFINSASCHLFGHAREVLLHQPLSDSLRAPNVAKLEAHFDKGLLAVPPETYKFEVTLESKNGALMDLEVAAVCIPFNTQPALQLVLRDITGRKDAESAITQMNEDLEVNLKGQAAKLETLYQEIQHLSSRTAMDRNATEVLHNVKNVLNSLVVSSSVMERILDQSRLPNLGKVSRLFQEHRHSLDRFLTRDPKGRMIPEFLESLANILDKEQEVLRSEIRALIDNLEHINITVNLQQRRARLGSGTMALSIEDLIDESVKICANSLTRYQIGLEWVRTDAPLFSLDRHKILQILVNLINNAAWAIDDAGRPPDNRWLKLGWSIDRDELQVLVRDNGRGIATEHQARLFEYGFTTRKSGHGFGLHSCRILANEMGGSLIAHSEGPDKGATLILTLPAKAPSELDTR